MSRKNRRAAPARKNEPLERTTESATPDISLPLPPHPSTGRQNRSRLIFDKFADRQLSNVESGEFENRMAVNFLREQSGCKKKKKGGEKRKKNCRPGREKIPVYPAMRFARVSTKSPRTNDGKNKAKK